MSVPEPPAGPASVRADRAALRRAGLPDAIALGLILLLVAAAGWRALHYRPWLYGEPGPGLFPLLVCGIAGLFAALALLGWWFGQPPPPLAEEDAAEPEGPVLWRKLLIYVATILVWPWLLPSLGFTLSSALALLVILRLAEGMSLAGTAAMLAVALASCWLVFERLLGVPLPHGPLGLV